jgi:hypothetical protein
MELKSPAAFTSMWRSTRAVHRPATSPSCANETGE